MKVTVAAAYVPDVKGDGALRQVHSRLEDANVRWQEAAKSYFEPRSFRRAINSCIQELRNTTWLLQKRKSVIEGFDQWYEQWQVRLRTDTVMTWLHHARTTVVKKGNLAALSTVRVTVLSDWLLNRG